MEKVYEDVKINELAIVLIFGEFLNEGTEKCALNRISGDKVLGSFLYLTNLY